MGNAESSQLPYKLGDVVSSYSLYSTHWILYDATDNVTNSQVSVFVFDKQKHPHRADCARNSATLLRQLRHPHILKFIATTETPTDIYLVTERVTPLLLPFRPPADPAIGATPLMAASGAQQADTHSRQDLPSSALGSSMLNLADHATVPNKAVSRDENELALTTSASRASGDVSVPPLSSTSSEAIGLLVSAGLHQVITAAQFLNTVAHIVHGNISPASIFISDSGDWKLSGFDIAFRSTNSSTSVPHTHAQTSQSQQADPLALDDDDLDFSNPQGTVLAGSSRPKEPILPSTQSVDAADAIGVIPPLFRSNAIGINKPYSCPEIHSNRWKQLEHFPIHCIDAYSIAKLLYVSLQGQALAHGSSSSSSASFSIPPTLINEYKLYFVSTPSQHLSHSASSTSSSAIRSPQAQQSSSPASILQPTTPELHPTANLPSHTRLLGSVYLNNHVISALNFIDHLTIKSDEEKINFFTQFATIYSTFPTSILRKRIVPQLIAAFDYITPKSVGSKAFAGIFNSTFAVARVSLPQDEYQQNIHPLVTTLFKASERSVRMYLLQNASDYIPLLSHEVIFTDILPALVVGLTDEYPLIRELTIKALPSFVTHFAFALNGSLDSMIMSSNMVILGNQLATGAYSYASTAASMISSYYQHFVSPTNAATGGGSTQSTNTSRAGSSSSSSQQQQQQQQQAQQRTIPSKYLSSLIFPALQRVLLSETQIASIRQAAVDAATALGSLLSSAQQEQLLLGIYGRALKDPVLDVAVAAFNGLLILLPRLPITTLCARVIPFVSTFVLNEEMDTRRKAIAFLQLALQRIEKHYADDIKAMAADANKYYISSPPNVGAAPSVHGAQSARQSTLPVDEGELYLNSFSSKNSAVPKQPANARASTNAKAVSQPSSTTIASSTATRGRYQYNTDKPDPQDDFIFDDNTATARPTDFSLSSQHVAVAPTASSFPPTPMDLFDNILPTASDQPKAAHPGTAGSESQINDSWDAFL